MKKLDDFNLAVLVVVVSLILGVLFSVVDAEKVDCPALPGHEVTELWWSLRTEQDPSVMALFMPYRLHQGVYEIGGVDVGFTSVAPSIRDNPNYSYDLAYSGWYIGDDGYPHPSCGVWLVEKSVLDNLRDK